MYPFFRKFLFRFDPEFVHDLTLSLLAIVGQSKLASSLLGKCFVPKKSVPLMIANIEFNNTIGLAAGYDKNGTAVQALAALGFGHIEVGTVTPMAQKGNPKPRIFRLPEDQAIINRMGFPSHGAEAVLRRLEKLPKSRQFVLGVNIGKNKNTPLEKAAQDYIYLIEQFNGIADYLTINISSPNTLGLRDLQSKKFLADLLNEITKFRDELSVRKPLFIKLAPDLNDQELFDALDIIIKFKLDAVIACNTTIQRPNLASAHRKQSGGLSGAPLSQISQDRVRKIFAHCGHKIPVIAAGGIMNKQDAKAMLEAGASLLQVFTGLIYEGPSLLKKLSL